MTTTANFTPTSVTLPPEGIEVLTKHFEFSIPVNLWREGDAWFKQLPGLKGKWNLQVNYVPQFWKEKE